MELGPHAVETRFQSFWLAETSFSARGRRDEPEPAMVEMSVAAHTKWIRLGPGRQHHRLAPPGAVCRAARNSRRDQRGGSNAASAVAINPARTNHSAGLTVQRSRTRSAIARRSKRRSRSLRNAGPSPHSRTAVRLSRFRPLTPNGTTNRRSPISSVTDGAAARRRASPR